MKSLRYTMLLVLFLQVLPLMTSALQKDGITKVIKKEFPVSPDAKLKLNNQFGDITCSIWDRNEISIEVTLSLDTKSEQTAEKIFSQIEILFRGSESSVEAMTKLSGRSHSKGRFSIDYQVMMPASVSLDLTNQFGDVMIKELNAKSAIRVEYGKASLGKLNHGDNLLDIAFGSASIEAVKGAVVMVKFSKMRIGYAGSLRINSQYTDIQAGEVVVMDGTYEGGKIDLDRTSVLTLKTRFSGFNVGLLQQKADLRTEFGSFGIKSVSTSLKSLVIENQHGSVDIFVPQELSYSLDAESRFGSIRFPKENASLSVSIVSGQEESYRGTIGSAPTAIIKIRNEFGSIKL